jgi:protein-disulfide isomerase
MKKSKLSIILATIITGTSLFAGTVSFSKIEPIIKNHKVYQNIKKLGFKVDKVYQDKDGLYTLTGEIPARTLPNGRKIKSQKVITFLSENGKYMIFGDVLKANGQKIEVPIPAVSLSPLKSKEAFTMGTGKENLYVFSDPDCPGCIGFFNSINPEMMKKYTIHYFLFPLESLHKNSKAKSLYILSQPKDKRMETYQLIEGRNSKIKYSGNDINITKDAKAELKESQELAKEVKLTHTPFILNEKGEVIRSVK